MSGSPSRAGRSHSHEGPYPIAPMAAPVSLSSMAQVLVASLNTVRIISKLSSTLLCGGQPARGPTSGSDAHLNSISASDSRQGRNRIDFVDICCDSAIGASPTALAVPSALSVAIFFIFNCKGTDSCGFCQISWIYFHDSVASDTTFLPSDSLRHQNHDISSGPR